MNFKGATGDNAQQYNVIPQDTEETKNGSRVSLVLLSVDANPPPPQRLLPPVNTFAPPSPNTACRYEYTSWWEYRRPENSVLFLSHLERLT